MGRAKRRSLATRTTSVDSEELDTKSIVKRSKYGRWKNTTSRNVELREISYWHVGDTKTLPASWAKEAEAAGLTYVGEPSP